MYQSIGNLLLNHKSLGQIQTSLEEEIDIIQGICEGPKEKISDYLKRNNLSINDELMKKYNINNIENFLSTSIPKVLDKLASKNFQRWSEVLNDKIDNYINDSQTPHTLQNKLTKKYNKLKNRFFNDITYLISKKDGFNVNINIERFVINQDNPDQIKIEKKGPVNDVNVEKASLTRNLNRIVKEHYLDKYLSYTHGIKFCNMPAETLKRIQNNELKRLSSRLINNLIPYFVLGSISVGFYARPEKIDPGNTDFLLLGGMSLFILYNAATNFNKTVNMIKSRSELKRKIIKLNTITKIAE